VIGDGETVRGNKRVTWSFNPSSANPQAPNVSVPGGGFRVSAPSVPTGPVLAVPVTGGAPVLVTPTAPMGGGVVTGVPVTGGVPVVGVPVAGGAMAGGATAAQRGAGGGGGGPAWVHILHVQVGKTSFTLECSVKPCAIDKKQIELGDALTIRREKNSAWVSFGAGSGAKEEKLTILGETEDGAAAK
jgi:hypothetical protein